MRNGLSARMMRWMLFGMLLATGSAMALDVQLTADQESIQVYHHGRLVTVQRIQDIDHVVDPSWGKTSRKCPPFCLQPITPVEGIAVVGEVELFDFMENHVNQDTGVLIDARLPDWHRRGTIPGSINIPFTLFDHEDDHPEVIRALEYLGAKQRSGVSGIKRQIEELLGETQKTEHWDFTEAKPVLLWCNGPWCGQSPRAIRALVKLGYPKEKIHYYRGGMQMWQVAGLPTVIPDPEYMIFEGAEGGGE